MQFFAACSLYQNLLNGSKISEQTLIEAKVQRLEKQSLACWDNLPTASERLLGGAAAPAAAGAGNNQKYFYFIFYLQLG